MTHTPTDFDIKLQKEDRRRTQTALIVLLIGLLLLISAWGLGMFRGTDNLTSTTDPNGTHKQLNSQDKASVAVFMFVYGSILLGVFVFTVISLVVASRSYRRIMFRRTKKESTPVEDIWSQHKVPEDVIPDDPEEE